MGTCHGSMLGNQLLYIIYIVACYFVFLFSSFSFHLIPCKCFGFCNKSGNWAKIFQAFGWIFVVLRFVSGNGLNEKKKQIVQPNNWSEFHSHNRKYLFSNRISFCVNILQLYFGKMLAEKQFPFIALFVLFLT